MTTEIDAGIFFVGHNNYICLPLTTLGVDEITSPSDVVSISTSCHCIKASIVGYYHNRSTINHALRLDFTSDSTTPADDVRIARLAVEVVLKFASGSSKSLTVNVLETKLVATTNPVGGRKHETL